MELAFTAFLIVSMALLLGGMLFMQVRYKQQAHAREKLLHTSTENKKLQALLRSMPPHYLSYELLDFIYRTLISNQQQMIELDKSNSKFLQSDLNEMVAQRRALHAGAAQEHEPMEGSDVDQANAARAGLKALYQYIKHAYESRQLTRAEAQKLLDEIEHRLIETGAGFYAEKAKFAQRQKRYKEAIAFWRKAADTYNRSRFSGQYQQRISEARSRIRQVQNEWREANRERNDAQAQELNEQLAEWAEEQDSWKKKHLYDDD